MKSILLWPTTCRTAALVACFSVRSGSTIWNTYSSTFDTRYCTDNSTSTMFSSCVSIVASSRPDRTPVTLTISTSSIRSEAHTSELQSLMRISYAVLCLNNNNHSDHTTNPTQLRHKVDGFSSRLHRARPVIISH